MSPPVCLERDNDDPEPSWRPAPRERRGTVTPTLGVAVRHDFETGLAHVTLDGPIDLPGAVRIRSAVRKCLGEHPLAVIVDLRAATVRDATTLLVFVTLARDMAAESIGLCAHATAGSATAVAARRVLGARVPVYDDRHTALARGAHPVRPGRMHAHLPPRVTSPASARSLVGEACRRWGLPELADRARVIVSELVSNAVVHAGTDLDVTVVLRETCLIIQLRDHDGPLPDRAPATADAGGGRGLFLVERLATGWGASTTPDGKTVWASLSRRALDGHPV